MFNIKRDLDLSENAVDTILKHIRKDLGRSGVERHTSEKIKAKSHSLSEFYTSENIEFEESIKINLSKVVPVGSRIVFTIFNVNHPRKDPKMA